MFKMSNSVYDKLKWCALILIPAVGTLYGALAPVWGWPFPDEIVYTITAVDTFIGTILGISNLNYKAGEGNG